MRKNIFTMMALAAALCACNKVQMTEPEVTEPDIETSAPLVFTATMESTPGIKATLDSFTPSWEVADAISINGFQYKANAAGTSSTFSMVGNGMASEIRPTYVEGSPLTNNEGQAATMLVDEGGTNTQWCDDIGTGLFIIVSTESECVLNSIKIWNGNDTNNQPGRRWKDVKVYGSSSADGPWDEDALIKSFTNLDLATDNKALAGELPVNATKGYKYYKVEVLSTMGESLQQMSDMKFVVTPSLTSPYKAFFPSNLYDGTMAVLPSEVTETWADGKFNMPMYAYSTTTDLQFKNLCGVLKITLKSDIISKVKCIRISSSNKAVSGEFSIVDNKAVLKDSSDPENAVTVTYTEAVNTSSEGTDFYVAIPPQTYQDLRIEFSGDGHNFKCITTTSGTNIVVERSKIYSITPTSSTLVTTGTAKAVINGQEVNVPWAQLWENGPKFAEYNIGVTDGQAESYGGYYSWGGHKNMEDDHNTGSEDLSGESDTATYIWGNNWRMPTKEELQALYNKDNCEYEWIASSEVIGYKFTGKGDYASNSVLLPAAGCYDKYGYTENYGIYWSATHYTNVEYAYCMDFSSDYSAHVNQDLRDVMSSVRAVLKE